MGNVGSAGRPVAATGDGTHLQAVAELPSPDRARATSVLRTELRALGDLQPGADPAGDAVDWDTLHVEGPTVRTGADRRSRFTYTATARWARGPQGTGTP